MRQKVAIIGSTKFNNYQKFKRALDMYIKVPDIEYIITRGLPGVEYMASMYCKEFDIYNKIYKIDPKMASTEIIANSMSLVTKADIVIIFNDGDVPLLTDIISIATNNGTKTIDIPLVEQKGTGQKTISKDLYKTK